MSVPIKRWKGTRARIEKILWDHPECRDDLDRVIAKIWWEDIKEDKLLSALGLLSRLSKGELTPPETIRRTWQLVQMKYPALRGKKYNERHGIGFDVQEKIVKE